jgi:hypothetical protein
MFPNSVFGVFFTQLGILATILPNPDMYIDNLFTQLGISISYLCNPDGYFW